MKLALLLALAVMCALPLPAQAPPEAAKTPSIQGIIRAEETRAAVAYAEIRVLGVDRVALSDSSGWYVLRDAPSGRLRVLVSAAGFRPYEVTVRVPRAGALHLDIDLQPRVQQLPRLDVTDAVPVTPDEAHSRDLFQRTVIPGVTTVSRTEVRSMPTPVAPDIMRSLQALPGMMSVNELDAQLYVRGGSGDQTLFLLDGAPVLGPYHAFGMSGVFNPDAIGRVDFFRGGRPARLGGVLSSVVELEQVEGESGEPFTEAGLSFFDARMMRRGALANDRARYMVAGRRTFTDAGLRDRFPFAFHDVQARVTTTPGGHRLTASAFTSSDQFDVFFGGIDGELRSRWSNDVASLRWNPPRWRGWNTSTSIWFSGYAALLRVGAGDSATVTRNRVRMSGARVEWSRGVLGARFGGGMELQHDNVSLAGSRTEGSFFDGETSQALTRPAAFVDAEQIVGPLRFAPGARLVQGTGGEWLAEPRLGVRVMFNDALSVTIAAARDHQLMSGLRDERTLLPGPPFWFMHSDGAPVSRADAISAELTAWAARGWSVTVGGYRKSFTDAPHWRPEGVRDLSSVSYDDGHSEGVEIGVRRSGQRTSGWLGYSYSRARFNDAKSGIAYDAPSDRRHTANVALTAATIAGIQLSLRSAFGTGVPFWPFVGQIMAPAFHPFLQDFSGGMNMSRSVPAWAPDQLRMAAYFRADVAVRRSFSVRGASVEPYVTVQNLNARPNVISYDLKSEPIYDDDGVMISTRIQLHPTRLPFTILPTAGVDIRF